MNESKIFVTGTGSATSPPDTAHVSYKVATTALKSNAALELNNERMQKLIESLNKYEVSSEDISTIDFNVLPNDLDERHYDEELSKESWTVTNRITANIKDIGSLGNLLSETGSIGSIEQLWFSSSKLNNLLNKARTESFKDAKNKALQYCKMAGLKLTGIGEIKEHDYGETYGGYMRMGTGVNISPNDCKKTISAEIVFYAEKL